jgi:hypothetical protein
MREIKLTVNPDGTTNTDFSGFLGKSCIEEAEKLKTLLASFGIRVEETNFVPKPELDIALQTTQDEQQRITQEGS